MDMIEENQTSTCQVGLSLGPSSGYGEAYMLTDIG